MHITQKTTNIILFKASLCFVTYLSLVPTEQHANILEKRKSRIQDIITQDNLHENRYQATIDMASVTSLDKDLRNLRLGKYTPQAAAEVRVWIELALAERLDPGDLLGALKDGVALCKYVIIKETEIFCLIPLLMACALDSPT